MRKLDSTGSGKWCVPLLVVLLKSVPTHAQVAFAAHTRPQKSSYDQQAQYPAETAKKPLREAIDELKSRYQIQVAFQQGLLDDKYVVAADVADLGSSKQTAENSLAQLLVAAHLQFKRIGAKQYVIYSSTNTQLADEVVKGKVVLEDGSGVPGATVVVKGTQIGTGTDAEGNFELKLPPASQGQPVVLVASFIGYAKMEVTVTNRAAPLTIKLAKSDQTLDEVVVTALGIAKQKRDLGYAVAEVKGEDLVQARENNVANALTGKVAGVNVAGLSTGPGGSSRVIIRGNGSLSGSANNQPLYVLNGMPMDNSVPGQAPTANGGGTNVDRGDGIASINPDDIESITVLKGGTAAALYGSRGGNGVILITTKKGRAQKGIGVEFNSTSTIESISVIPEFQYEYGQGDGGVKPTTLAAAQSTGRRSWGARLDGSTDYVGVDGQTHPYVAQKDNLKHFYQLGRTFTNTLALSGGNEGIAYRFSLSNLDSEGLLPGSTYNRKTGNLNLSGKLSPRLSYEALAQYNIETANKRPSAGDALANPNWSPYMIANSADVRWLKPGYDANGYETVWNDASVATNGYFVVNKFQQDDRKNRFIGQASLSYELAKNLVLKGTVSQDHYDYNYRNITPTGTLYALTGQYAGIKSDVSETNALATLTYNKQIKEVGLSFLAGANKRRSSLNELDQAGTGFTIPFFYSYNNLASGTTLALAQRQDVNSVFGSADFNYKSLFFLTVTGRNDWYSTLSPSNNSKFYPSINGSFIVSDVVDMPRAVNLVKLRGAYAQVGQGAPEPYAVNLTYSNVPSSGRPLQNVSSNVPGSGLAGITNANLGPVLSTTTEGGLEAQLLDNRLSLDLTYYNRLTDNDIVNTTISPTSGYNSVYLNAGKVRNRGIEALVSGTPIRTANFSWNTSYNLAYNDNKVLQLVEGINSINLASTVGNWAYINNTVGQSAFEIVGTRIQKDENGNTVFDAASGYPVATALQPLGKSVAPLTMGFSNDFRYKRLSLNVLLDGKFGNKVFSISEVYETRLGLLKSTLPGRENGLQLTGVTSTGDAYSRLVPVSGLRAYYDNYKNYSELFLHDGGFIKLRQVILAYNLPAFQISSFKLQSATIAFVARNLLILMKHTNFDPEQSFSNSNYQGLESIGLPRTRSYGLNLSVKF
ncbi:SusC/RagA family TonB-linked outer membrane protein [Hymenobacter defluvii]|uniref:SusC/RagA family TonB-linked outer membrane protein n=1 Tax=Hymenobacter defluvii TaxID=2054411 RepID=A0ABS3T9T3_9BACT|nr:SusC/RagA family TonB-linked outer membrane protein [Hymenobacter defluvii]MBO3269384.1 SusC/RagA family TonB-linked outer membrane protein [Hymenobacter defluvii]